MNSILKERTCFLFDLDGTLVDSSPCHEQAFLLALNERHPELAGAFIYEEHKGKRTETVFTELGILPELIAEMTEKKQRLYREMVADGKVNVLPGAREILLALRQLGQRSFLITGGSRASVEAVLKRYDLSDLFEGTVTGSDVSNSKPAPDCFLKCVNDFALDRSQSLVVEDAANGVESAKAADLEVVVVNNEELAHTPEYVCTLLHLHLALIAARQN